MFSEVYDIIRSKCSEVLTAHKELINPYALEDINKDDNLAKGFGVEISSSDVQELPMLCYATRAISISVTRRLVQTNVATRIAKEKELIADIYNLSKELKKLKQCSYITNIEVLGDDGISFIEDYKYITTKLNLTVTYQEYNL